MKKKQTILITGASGKIGSAILKDLIKKMGGHFMGMNTLGQKWCLIFFKGLNYQ